MASLLIVAGISGSLLLEGAAGDPAPNLAKSILLADAVDTHGARCLDGSPQRIWLQRSQSALAANRSKWYFHFMGGGWCESEADCTARAYQPSQCYRGSSLVDCFNGNGDLQPGKKFNETMDFRDIPCINGARWGGGLLMSTPDTNPLTHDWNKVEIQYCDGGSYGGNQEQVSNVSYAGTDDLPLYYRGQRNLEATMDYLIKNEGLNDASYFVVSGDSAGGLATFWHADYFQTKLPGASVLAVPDSGFFIGDDSKPQWPKALQWIAEAMNSTAGLDQSCVAAAAAAGKAPGVSCTLPEDVTPHIEVPVFVLNSRFDPALKSISSQALDYNTLGEHFLAKLHSAVLGDGYALGADASKNAAFVTACAQHCGQWAQGQVLAGHNDFNVTINGWTAATALDAWAKATWEGMAASPRFWLQTSSYPCKDCCSGGHSSELIV